MTDIVERLRWQGSVTKFEERQRALMHEAADTIEQLRAERHRVIEDWAAERKRQERELERLRGFIIERDDTIAELEGDAHNQTDFFDKDKQHDRTD